MRFNRLWSVILIIAVMMGLSSHVPPISFGQGGSNLAPDGVSGETYYAPFPVSIALDGEFDDWAGVPLVHMEQSPDGPAVNFGAAADGEFIYLYGDIIDSNIISGEHGEDYWNEDSIEFYLNGTGDLTLSSYTDGVVQITIPALDRNLPPEEAIISGVRGLSANAKLFAVPTEEGWSVEVAVPLKSDIWDITPKHEAEIGFQVHLNVAAEKNRSGKLMWSIFDASDKSYQDPSLFGKLIFYEASAQPTAAVIPGVYQFSSVLDEDGALDDFENGIWMGYDNADLPMGLVPAENSALAIRQVLPGSEIALPEQKEVNNVLAVQYATTGGFQHIFTDGSNRIQQDWSAYNALGFWLSGSVSGTISLLAGDSAELWTSPFTNETEGWQYVIVPFALLQSSSGSPLPLTNISGYGFEFTSTNEVNNAYLDNFELFTAENTTGVSYLDAQPKAAFVIDESITWDSREWSLLWSDEFEGVANTPINADNWTCETGGNGWGNGEWEYYTDRVENVSLDGTGNLAIVAREENPNDYTCHYGHCTHTSARCITANKVEFTYGRVEARLKIPYGQGIWPAFWMLGANFRQVGWPGSGEIDIMENVGFEPQTVHGTVHGPRYSGANGIGGGFSLDEDFSADFHVYAIEWDANVIRWYVDGELYKIVSLNDMGGREWVFDHDFFLLLNVAVGGAWPGFPDETTVFPQTMLVDYVRVYQLTAD
ncbi:MAG: family 16 glycosylhydrolase [Chloroflexi bacterium]|nr:family 16 glycosylhydrolase [Chloroflexota bacterium]